MWKQSSTPSCALCDRELDPNNHFFSEHGPICDLCEYRGEQKARFKAQYRSAGYGALAAGLTSLFLNPYFAFSFMAASSAVWAFRSAQTHDVAELEILRAHPGPKIAAFVAIPVTVLGVVLGVTQWVTLISDVMA